MLFFQAEDGIRDIGVTGVQTCALPILSDWTLRDLEAWDEKIRIKVDNLGFFSSRRRHTRYWRDWSSYVCSSDLQGLDGLGDRLAEYRELGARFTKWRAVVTIGEGIPTKSCIDANAEALALYAAFAQDHDLVPIVEPEVLIDGDHSIGQSYEATEWMLHATFEELHEHGVELSGMLLKPNMVISGKEASEQSGVEEVARATVECLLRTVPAAVPGIVFLSGGQTDLQATAHLNAMNALYENLPWELSFSYARALQDLPMKTWKGDPSNVEEAQKAFYHRAKMNSAARSGSYSEDMEQAA